MDKNRIASYIDHTLLAPTATKDAIKSLCEEAVTYHFASVCVHGSYTSMCAKLLEGSNVKVCTVVGFPLGSSSSESKAFEAEQAIRDGSDEIDMVLNIGRLLSGDNEYVLHDIKRVKEACKERVLKVIIETALLNEEQKRVASEIVKESGADYIKTSTGFSHGGATVEDVELMKSIVGEKIGVKAAGGIRSYQKALQMIEAGASRLGTSSGVAIINGIEDQKGY